MSVCCDPTEANCQSFQTAFQQVGDAFYDFCESTKTCAWKLTSGPSLKDINTRSLIAVATNRNNFPVKVQIIINQIDDGPITAFYCETKEIPACNSRHFTIVDMSALTMNFYSVNFVITKPNGDKVCDKVRLYAAGRSDLASVPVANSHLIPSEVFTYSMFVDNSYDAECAPVCPRTP